MSQQSLCDLKGLEDAGLSLYWKYEETASTISEGFCDNREMDMPARVGACRQGFLLPQFFYLACHQKVLGHIEGESSCLKSSDQENPLQECTAACVLVDSRCNRADSQS